MSPAAPEFARAVDTKRRLREAEVHEIAASAEERAALARRFGLLALERLEATVRLAHAAGGCVRLSARLRAEVVQSCVATLEPVSAAIEEDFSLLFAPDRDADPDLLLRPEDELIESLGDGIIDIGEAVAQQLSLALDPYPRASSANSVTKY